MSVVWRTATTEGCFQCADLYISKAEHQFMLTGKNQTTRFPFASLVISKYKNIKVIWHKSKPFRIVYSKQDVNFYTWCRFIFLHQSASLRLITTHLSFPVCRILIPQYAKRLTLFEGTFSHFKGMQVIPARGHTDNHYVYRFSSMGRTCSLLAMFGVHRYVNLSSTIEHWMTLAMSELRYKP